MDNKLSSSNADEKTKIIQVNKPAETAAQKPVQAASPLPAAGAKTVSPFASYFQGGNTKAKRTIMAGALGGGLLVSLIALTSFNKKPDEAESTAGNNEAKNSGEQSSSITAPGEGEVVQINTGHEVYTGIHDDLTLDEARDIARENVGTEGLFMYKSELHLTRTDEEWNALPAEQKLEVLNNINVTPAPADEKVTIQVDVDGVLTDLKVDALHRADMIQFGEDDGGHTFLIAQGRPAVELANITMGDEGIMYRTDPGTGEVSVVTVDEVFTQLNDQGQVHTSVLIPGLYTEPVIEGTYMYGYVDGAESDDYGSPADGSLGLPAPEYLSGYGWGWDTDGDGDIDVYDHHFQVTAEPDPLLMPEYYEDVPVDNGSDTTSQQYVEPVIPEPPVAMTDEELLHERVLQIAREGGIDDISKIKVHDNHDGTWDIKIKGDDGEKIKTTITTEDLHQPVHTDTSTPEPEFHNPGEGQSDVVSPQFLAAEETGHNPIQEDGGAGSQQGQEIVPDDITTSDLHLNLNNDATSFLNQGLDEEQTGGYE